MELSRRTIEEMRAAHPNHAFLHRATTSYWDGPLDREGLEAMVARVSRSRSLVTSERACLVFGRGSQTREVYRRLQEVPGTQLLWDGPVMPWWLRPLSILAAAHGGLLQASRADAAAEALRRLAVLATVELYSFHVDRLEAVLRHAKAETWRARIGRLAGEDPSYFTFGVDGDSLDSTTGIFAWASHGEDCPPDLAASIATA